MSEPANSKVGAAPSLEATVAKIRALHPSVRTSVAGSRIERVYGVAASGNSAEEAAENFKRVVAPSFGVDAEELVPARLGATSGRAVVASGSNGIGLMYDRATGKHKFRLFYFEQQRDGVPVYASGLRALVREEGRHRVVWANPSVRPLGQFRPRKGLRADAIDWNKSLQSARANAALTHGQGALPTALRLTGSPSLTIFAGAGDRVEAPRMARLYTAEDVGGAGKWTFVADAETFDILHVESNFHHDITGSVRAEIVPGPESAECSTLGEAPLPYAEITSPEGNVFTDASGAFLLTQSGSAPVSLTSSVSGQFFDIINDGAPPASLSLSVTPPGPASFYYQDPQFPPELLLAQVNAYFHVNAVRDFLLAYVPEYPVISQQSDFPVHVNRTHMLCDATGGAWYDNDGPVRSIHFCQRTAERSNTAFGAIVYHEYGHHIVDSGGSGQNAYGEGMADTITMLLTKDPQIGRGYYHDDCSRPLRLANRDCQYDAVQCSSCGPGNYECGALISGIVWDIWQELDVTEPGNADDIIRSLVLSSIPLHTGSSIEPSIAVDFLTLDDDDGLIENGTPHYSEICAGFAAHGIDCPPIVDGLVVKGDDLFAQGQAGGPFEPLSTTYTLHNLGPEASLTYSVSTSAPWLSVSSTGGTIALGSSTTVTVSLDAAQAALLPEDRYTGVVEFVNVSSGTGSTSREATLRVGVPVPVYAASFDSGLEGFTPDSEPGNLWHRSTACLDGLPGHTSGGFVYYGKDDVCNYTTSTPIRHTITSPWIPFGNPQFAELGFKYHLQTEDDPNYDTAEVLVSVAGGPFQVVASNNSGGVRLTETTTWREVRLDLSSLLPPSGQTSIQVQFAFNAGDPKANVKTGFGVDDVVLYSKPVVCAVSQECDDGLYCNGVEACVDNVCVPGVPVNCDDENECTHDACDEENDACVFTPNSNPCADDGDECTVDYCDNGVCVHETFGFCPMKNAFVEQNGMVVIEAESFSENTPRGAHYWEQVANSLASGQTVMRASPNFGAVIDTNYALTSPELRYPIKFSTTGTYYVWVRGIGLTGNDDSLHVGLRGVEVPTADRIGNFSPNLTWSRDTMDNAPATLTVSEPGYLDLSVWMREDGFLFDKIILTTNPNYYPWGNGPGESAREGALGQSPCAAFCANPIAFDPANYQSGNIGTGEVCYETTGELSGGVCGNFAPGRRLYVNGVEVPCNWAPWPSLPAAQNGGYCITSTAGDYAWAAFATW